MCVCVCVMCARVCVRVRLFVCSLAFVIVCLLAFVVVITTGAHVVVIVVVVGILNTIRHYNIPLLQFMSIGTYDRTTQH